MTLNKLFQFFVPKDKKFFPLFEQASTNLILLAETLHEAVNAPKAERENYFRKIEELEAVIEEITHKTHLELSRNFITPFDREDIHSLASALDDIADYIYASGKKINFYQIDPISDQGIQKTAEAILEAQTGEFERLKEFGIKASKQGDDIKFTFKGVETKVKDSSTAITAYLQKPLSSIR